MVPKSIAPASQVNSEHSTSGRSGLEWIQEDHRVQVEAGQEIYCRLTYHPESRGKIPIVCCNGIGVSTVFWQFVQEQFCNQRPVLVWDYRGHGLTEIPKQLSSMTIARALQDLDKVLEYFGFESVVLLGHSMGAQLILDFAASRPQKVTALVPMLGTYGRPIHTFFDQPMLSVVTFRLVYGLTMSAPGIVNKLKSVISSSDKLRSVMVSGARVLNLVDRQRMPTDLLKRYLEHLGRMDIRVFMSLARDMAFHSVESRLSEIIAPVLVVAATGDSFTPLWLSEELADRLTKGELFVLQGGSHAALVEQPEVLQLKLQAFFDRHVPSIEC